MVDRAAAALRAAPSALGHGDINMWNIIVSEDRVTLIDWDWPVICDPACEIALIDKHAWLFNARGINPAFFDGYGTPPAEPNTTLHRVVQTINWVGSADWEEFERSGLPAEQIARLRRRLDAQVKYRTPQAHVMRSVLRPGFWLLSKLVTALRISA